MASTILSNYTSKNKAMSLEQENKKLRERVEEMEIKVH